jgi:hypothetical protein
MDTLMGYAWPDNVDPTSRTFRKRRAAVNKALDKLKRITWKVHEYAIAKYHIARPALLETTPGLTVPNESPYVVASKAFLIVSIFHPGYSKNIH